MPCDTNQASSPEMCPEKLATGRPAASAAPSDPPGTDERLQTSHISAFVLLRSTQ